MSMCKVCVEKKNSLFQIFNVIVIYEVDQPALKKLWWMLQKDSLSQDMFLIGPLGPEKLWIAHVCRVD